MIRKAIVLTLFEACVVFSFNPNSPLDRPFTLRNQGPFLLELDYARMIAGESALGFIRPRPCRSPLDSTRSCSSGYRLKQGSDSGNTYIGLGIIGAEEYRYEDVGAWSTEAGGLLEGGQGPASFSLDARVFSESEGGPGRPSYDREAVDVQSQAVTGSVSYRSYSRYRGDFDLDLPFGRLSAGRDAAHWGPGLIGNLVFNQEAVPFDQASFSTWLGPVSVISLYGDLAIGENQAYDSINLQSRSLYAHRYELRLGSDWLVGMSEQLILYGQNKPLLMVPIIPLFIAKGLMFENSNNGNLSLDAAYRLRGLGMVYGEFLLDDLESPSSLFTKDYIQNKWAILAGLHLIRHWEGMQTGLILEYTRIEPWVYTHFIPETSQAANAGYPLGNQQGPDSRSVVAEIYGRHPAGFGLSTRIGLYGKGRGPGSGLEDAFPSNSLQRKGDFSDRAVYQWLLQPMVSWNRGRLGLRAGGVFGDRTEGWLRLAYVY
jgi:hypothetical protein